MSLKSRRYNLLDLPHSCLRTQANTELLHDLAIKRVNNGAPATESSRGTTLRKTSKQTQIHTRTQGGLKDLLSSPPVVCSGVWLSPRPPFKGSAVVWTNKAVAQDHAITTDPARIFLLALKEMFPWLSPVSLANVFYLNSPAGHTTWYVGCTHSCCTHMHIEHSGPKMTWPPGMWTLHLLVWQFNRRMWTIDGVCMVFNFLSNTYDTHLRKVIFDVGPSAEHISLSTF